MESAGEAISDGGRLGTAEDRPESGGMGMQRGPDRAERYGEQMKDSGYVWVGEGAMGVKLMSVREGGGKI